MSQTHVAGGPLEWRGWTVPGQAPRSHNPQRLIRRMLAAVGLVIRVLAGAAIVEAVAISSFGVLLGTLIAGLAALVIVPVVFALRR